MYVATDKAGKNSSELIAGLLESLSWLLLAFCLNILRVGGTYESLFCSKMNAAAVVWTAITLVPHYELPGETFTT